MFPSPLSVARTLWAGFTGGSFPLAIGTSLRRIAIGYGTSLAIGLAVDRALLTPLESRLRERWGLHVA